MPMFYSSHKFLRLDTPNIFLDFSYSGTSERLSVENVCHWRTFVIGSIKAKIKLAHIYLYDRPEHNGLSVRALSSHAVSFKYG